MLAFLSKLSFFKFDCCSVFNSPVHFSALRLRPVWCSVCLFACLCLCLLFCSYLRLTDYLSICQTFAYLFYSISCHCLISSQIYLGLTCNITALLFVVLLDCISFELGPFLQKFTNRGIKAYYVFQ